MSKEMKMTALNTNAKLEGIIHDTAAFLEKYQLTDRSLWMRFVDQFRDGLDADKTNGTVAILTFEVPEDASGKNIRR